MSQHPIFSTSKYNQLQQKIKEFEEVLSKKQNEKLKRKQKVKQQWQNLQQTLEQKNSNIFHKIQELKRKETIILTLNKIEPDIPQNFPKNYYCQVLYEDVDFNGNPKFVDFDENIIQEKFVLPLLNSIRVRIQIMIAQENPTLFDEGAIDLQKAIQGAIMAQKYESQFSLINNSDYRITYSLNLQGIGFESWLKTRAAQRDLQQQRKVKIQMNAIKNKRNVEKVNNRKQKFNNLFKNHGNNPTQQYDLKEVNNILKMLEE